VITPVRSHPVAAQGSVAPGANVRPAAPPCPRFQLTREYGELPSVVWGGTPAEYEYGAF